MTLVVVVKMISWIFFPYCYLITWLGSRENLINHIQLIINLYANQKGE